MSILLKSWDPVEHLDRLEISDPSELSPTTGTGSSLFADDVFEDLLAHAPDVPVIPAVSTSESSDEDMATNNQRPDAYNGFGSPTKFFAKLEDWLEAKEKPRDSWMAQLKPFLKGSAYQYLQDLIDTEDSTANCYDTFKSALADKFQDPRAKWVKSWSVRTKQKTSSVRKYAEKFQSEAEDMDLDIESEGIKTAFVKGLRSELRTQVLRSGDIGTFTELLKAALVAEMANDAMSSDSDSEDERPPKKASVRQVSVQPTNVDDRFDTLSEQIGQVMQMFTTHMQHSQQPAPRQDHGESPPPSYGQRYEHRTPHQPPLGPPPRSRNPRTAQGEPLCRRCMQPGHFERSCPYDYEYNNDYPAAPPMRGHYRQPPSYEQQVHRQQRRPLK